MIPRVIVLGAGFGGLEVTTILSETFGESIDLLLLDKSDAFVFGFSKLDVMFGRTLPEATRHPYRDIDKPGVRFLRTTILSFDPATKRVITTDGDFDADVLVVALGAEYDFDATPGLLEHGNEFYTVQGALAAREKLAAFEGGPVVVGIAKAPYKCPPAPSEAAMMVHDFLVERGVRETSSITMVTPLPRPIPPSPETSAAILERFAERGIDCIVDARVMALDGARRVVTLSDGRELPYGVFLGIPAHRAAAVARVAFGLPEDGWVPVNDTTLATPYPGVFAVGDVCDLEMPMSGVLAEGAGRIAAQGIIAHLRGEGTDAAFDGRGTCYIEFGGGEVGRVDIDFGGEVAHADYRGRSAAFAEEKETFGACRARRWFGREWSPSGE